jgi:predicted Zn-dependent peptidase
MDLYFHTLPNGIKLVHLESTSQVAHCGFFINTGSRDEELNEHGMAHFIEHLIFKGTSKRKAFHILSRMEDVGGEVNAFTTKEETCVHTSFLVDYYGRALELIADIFFNSTFPEKAIETEREVILDEINSYKDSPSEQICDDFEDQVFFDHPLGRNILGAPACLQSINRELILNFIQRSYNTDQMVLASVGNISFPKIKHMFEKYFQDIPSNFRKVYRVPFSNYKVSNREFVFDTNQVHVTLGGMAYDLADDRRMALHLLTNILAGPGMISRLNLALREKYGYSYNVESNFSPFTDSGIFSVYFSTDKEYVSKCLDIVYSEFTKLQNNLLGGMQLKKAKQQIIGQLAISFESQENQMLSIGKSYLVYGKVDSMETIYKKIESITANQLRDIANDILQRDKLSILIFK